MNPLQLVQFLKSVFLLFEKEKKEKVLNLIVFIYVSYLNNFGLGQPISMILFLIRKLVWPNFNLA